MTKKGKQFFLKAVGTTEYVKERAFLWKFMSGMCADKSSVQPPTNSCALASFQLDVYTSTDLYVHRKAHTSTLTHIPMLLLKMVNLESEIIQLVSASEYNCFLYRNCWSATLSSMCKYICMITKKEPSIRNLFSMIQCHSWPYSREDLYTLLYNKQQVLVINKY